MKAGIIDISVHFPFLRILLDLCCYALRELYYFHIIHFICVL